MKYIYSFYQRKFPFSLIMNIKFVNTQYIHRENVNDHKTNILTPYLNAFCCLKLYSVNLYKCIPDDFMY